MQTTYTGHPALMPGVNVTLFLYAAIIRGSAVQSVNEDPVGSARSVAFRNHDGITFRDDVAHAACRAEKMAPNLGTHCHRVGNIGKRWLAIRRRVDLVEHTICSNDMPMRQSDILRVSVKQDSQSVCVLSHEQLCQRLSNHRLYTADTQSMPDAYVHCIRDKLKVEVRLSAPRIVQSKHKEPAGMYRFGGVEVCQTVTSVDTVKPTSKNLNSGCVADIVSLHQHFSYIRHDGNHGGLVELRQYKERFRTLGQ